MKALNHPPSLRQRGAIAVLTGILLIFVFVPLGGLVVDLGHLYIAKAELQNAADAAALAAAKDLNNKADGIDAAIVSGQAVGAKHKYDFTTSLSLQASDFWFATTPDGPWNTQAQAKAAPAGMTFVKVDTGAKTMPTFLMGAAGIASTATNGVAVAGRYVTVVTPIGICAADPAHRTAEYTYPSGLKELVEFGFRRGVGYNLFELGSLGGATYDPYLINPVDTPPSCDASNSSANSTAPFVCNGNSAVITLGSGQVNTNTGMTASIEKALNSRFDDFSGGSKCDPVQAPPDINVKEYPYSPSSPINWQDAAPTQQTMSTTGNPLAPRYAFPAEGVTPATPVTRLSNVAPTYANYGALWAYGPAVRSDGAATPAAGAPITTAEANANTQMYSSGTAFNGSYPTSLGTGFSSTDYSPAPYNQGSGSPYFQAPTHTGTVDRRILNLVLVDCRTPPSGSASCGVMTAVGIGKFFMMRKADLTSGSRHLDVEFEGLIEPVPDAAVRLYR